MNSSNLTDDQIIIIYLFIELNKIKLQSNDEVNDIANHDNMKHF